MLPSENRKLYRIPLFCSITLLYWFSMYTYVPILVTYAEQLGASHRMAGMIVGAYGLIQMLQRFPAGIASNRFNRRKPFIAAGLALACLSGIGLWLTNQITLIILFRGLAGAAATTWVDFTILYTSYHKQEEVTKAIGTMNFYNAMGIVTAMLAGGWIAERIDIEATFLLGAVAGFVAMLGSFFLVEKHDQDHKKVPLNAELSYVLKDRTLITVSCIAMVFQILTLTTVFGFTPVFAEQLGADQFGLGLLGVLSFLPTALASLLGGRWLSRTIGEKNIIVLGFVLIGLFTATIPFTTNFTLLVITQALAGLGRGLSFPMLMALSIKHVPANKQTTAMGFFQSAYSLGMFAGPFLVGWVSDAFSLTSGFVILGFVGFATAVLCQGIIRTRNQPLDLKADTIKEVKWQ